MASEYFPLRGHGVGIALLCREVCERMLESIGRILRSYCNYTFGILPKITNRDENLTAIAIPQQGNLDSRVSAGIQLD
jgi:hypothetical protein